MSNRDPASARLDFDRLVRDYLENLNVSLRGFKAAESFDFLEAWVPHDDPTENLLELIDLARDSGLARLTVFFSAETAARLDAGHIVDVAGKFGSRQLDPGIELEFALTENPRAARRSRPADAKPRAILPEVSARADSARPDPSRPPDDSARQLLDIHPCYRAALQQVLGDVRHQGKPDPVAGLTEVAALHGGWQLMALVDANTTLVRQAGFSGAGPPVELGLMEMLCRSLLDRPIQDCADHAALVVEHALRDKTLPPPVRGLIAIENAAPVFQLPDAIVRQLLAEFRNLTGYRDTKNFYDRPASPSWIKLSAEERCQAIERGLAQDSSAGQLELVRMDGLKRAVVKFSAALTSQQQQELLVRLESVLRETVEPTLHLTIQARADANILRMPERKK